MISRIPQSNEEKFCGKVPLLTERFVIERVPFSKAFRVYGLLCMLLPALPTLVGMVWVLYLLIADGMPVAAKLLTPLCLTSAALYFAMQLVLSIWRRIEVNAFIAKRREERETGLFDP